MDTTDTAVISAPPATADERVAAGIAWLRRSGLGYGLDIGRVDTSTMSITDGTRCVLAQAGGSSYAHAIDRIEPRPQLVTAQDWEAYQAWTFRQDTWATAHGFLPETGPYGPRTSDVARLTDEWRRQLPPAGR